LAKKRAGKKKTSGRKVRVDLRKNRGKAVRDKGEVTRLLREDEVRQDEIRQVERVRPKGALSRKRTVIVDESAASRAALRRGIVVAVRGLVSEVDDGEQFWACTVRRVLRTLLMKERQPITVGDAVRFSPVDVGGEQSRLKSGDRTLPEGVIEEVDERKTLLMRKYDDRIQVIASNVDNGIIVVAADQPTLRPHLIDRYLVAVHQGDMRPVVCINKADLDTSGFAVEVVERYRRLGYVALLTCVPTGTGLDELAAILKDATSVLVGPSGVGKSSIINALDPGIRQAVGSVTDLQRGRHTTTTSRLLKWRFGGYVVDTPGMRQFEPADVEPEELEAYFKEFIDLVPACKFMDCSHTHEAGCAIKAAVETEEIDPARYDSYCKMYEEAAARPRY